MFPRGHRVFRIGALALAVFQTTATATGPRAPIRLFHDDGTQVANYNQLVVGLQTNDVLVFIDENGRERTFTIRGPSRIGSWTRLLDIGNGRLLRIPKARDGRSSFTDVHRRWAASATELQASGVPMPILYPGGRPGQFTEVERIDIEYTLEDLMARRASDHRTELAGLVDFARATAEHEAIGDFHPAQLGWSRSRKRWVLFDWDQGHERFSVSTSERHFLTEDASILRWLPNETLRDLRRAVLDRRRTIAFWEFCLTPFGP